MHIITGLQTGGAENMLYKLLCSQIAGEHRVISLSEGGKYKKLLEEKGIEVHEIPLKRGIFSGILKARKYVNHYSPEILQGWMYHGNIFCHLIAGATPIIWNIRSTSVSGESLKSMLLLKTAKILSRFPKRIIFNSHVSLEEHCAMGFPESRCAVLPNGFDLAKLAYNPVSREEIRKEHGIAESDYVIVHIARFHEMKDHETLFKAIDIVFDEYPNTKLICIGKGIEVENSELREYLYRTRNGKDKIKLLGEKDEVGRFLSASDLLVSSSFYGEGFPNVLGEALACGLPCVATDVGDSRILLGSYGEVVEPKDPNKLANAIMNIKQQKYTAESRASRVNYMSKYSIEKISQKYDRVYMDTLAMNVDRKTVEGFGKEWSRFDQSSLSEKEHQELFETYFGIFPWNKLPNNSIGFDMGCGSGRWAQLVAPKVGTLICADASNEALEVAKSKLSKYSNCQFRNEPTHVFSVADDSMDFGYSLGVLHHIPDTKQAMMDCVRKLKKGAPFLVYLYYSLDNKPKIYQFIWRISNIFRMIISSAPEPFRYFVSQIIALTVYFPLARGAKFLNRMGFSVSNLPLAAYRDCSFYTMRTDALDRFGTRLEHRFSRIEIEQMMKESGLENITFSEKTPHWVAVGYKK